MTDKEYTKNSKREAVIKHIKDHEPIEQSKIAHHFLKEFGYSNIDSARASLSRLLGGLEKSGVLKKVTAMNHSSGSIDKNIWSTN